MSVKKSYLSEQIRLVTLTGNDFFSEEEHNLYMQIIELSNELDKLYEDNAPEEQKAPLLDKKKELKHDLEELIKTHAGVPRTVRVASVTWGDLLPGVTWQTLKSTRRIAEFACELSRAMGLSPNDETLDLIVVKWKNIDQMHQLVVDGFYMPILHEDGSVENRKYRFYTASAGQLRRDKILCMSEVAWEKCKDRLECGLSDEEINRKNGCNVN